MKNKTFLKNIFIVVLYMSLAGHLTAEELTNASVELIYTPKFLPAEDLKIVLDQLSDSELQTAVYANKLICTGSTHSVASAEKLLRQLDLRPVTVNVFFDFDHVANQHPGKQDKHTRYYQSGVNRAELTATGLANEPIILQLTQPQAFSIFPILATNSGARAEFVKVIVSPLDSEIWVSLDVQYRTKNSTNINRMKTKTLLQPGRWQVLTPEDARPLFSPEGGTKSYSTKPPPAMPLLAIKVEL